MSMPGVTASTKVACIIGWPASRSLSPVIHNAGFAAAGLDWIYAAFEVPPAAVGAAIEGVRALGIAGVNVTMPHKAAVIPFLDDLTPAARAAQAVNTIVNDGGRLIGDNTDGAGFVRFLQRDADHTLQGAPVLVLGAGGSARAIAMALGQAGAAVTVAARKPEAAAVAAAPAGGVSVEWDRRGDAARTADVIVAAIPSVPGELPALHATDIRPGSLIVDLTYAPPATPLMAQATDAGASARNGLGMLLHQAVLAFERWTGGPAPEPAMAAALAAATGGG